MQFVAYITRRELQQHSKYDVPISRIAQIFAADVMPQHCGDYASRCAVSNLAMDTMNSTSRPTTHPVPLIPAALPASSQFTFHGYRAGVLESFLLQAASSDSQPEAVVQTTCHPVITSSVPPYGPSTPYTSPRSITPPTSGAKFPSPKLIDASIRRIHKNKNTGWAATTVQSRAKISSAIQPSHQASGSNSGSPFSFASLPVVIKTPLRFRSSTSSSASCDDGKTS